MNLFWLYALGLTLLASCFILFPFRSAMRRGSVSDSEGQGGRNLDLHRQRLAELEAAYEEGELDQEAYEIQVEEAQRVLLEDVEIPRSLDSSRADGLPGGVSDRSIGIISSGVLLLLSWIWFSDSGLSQGSLAELTLTEKILESRDTPQSRKTLLELVDTVEQARIVSPSNEQLEFYLGQLRLAVGDFSEAVAIFEALVLRYPGDGEIVGFLAQARYLQQDREMTTDLKVLFERAIALAPQNVGLLEILGMEAFKSGDTGTAKRRFEQALVHASGPRAELIERLLKDLSGAQEAPSITAESFLSDAEGAARAAPPKISADQRRIIVRVTAAVGTNFPRGARLFVFARALNGPPMPLAVGTRDAINLPLEVTLDETMAMMPGLSLAEFDQVEVVARVSASGDAIARPGDIEVTSGAIALAPGTVQVDLMLGNGS